MDLTGNTPFASTEVDVANWLQQVLSKLKKEKEEKKKDNQYKLNKAMAIAIGLISWISDLPNRCIKTMPHWFGPEYDLLNLFVHTIAEIKATLKWW